MFASLAVTAFRPVYAGGLLFGIARWGLGFLAAFVANDLTASPRAVQLTGVAMWLPLLFAGVIAGALADRWDRRALLVGAITALVPVVVVVGLLARAGQLRAWMLYPAMLVVGLSWVVDITARRTLVLDIVGVRLIDNAMALEALSSALALAVGVLAGGAIVEAVGAGQAFLALAVVLVAAVALLARVSYVPSTSAGTTARSQRRGIRDALSSRALRSVLGVTILANLFYFSHTPLVPVFASRLDVGPFGAGLLASAGGLGMAVAAIGVAVVRPPRGITYVIGAALALAAVTGLTQAGAFPLAFAAALVAATGFGLFAATQAVVTMTSVDPDLRGRAMGLLSMAIGALPIGMLTLGELAEHVGPATAVTCYAVGGLVALMAWVVRRPEVLRAGR